MRQSISEPIWAASEQSTSTLLPSLVLKVQSGMMGISITWVHVFSGVGVGRASQTYEWKQQSVLYQAFQVILNVCCLRTTALHEWQRLEYKEPTKQEILKYANYQQHKPKILYHVHAYKFIVREWINHIMIKSTG